MWEISSACACLPVPPCWEPSYPDSLLLATSVNIKHENADVPQLTALSSNTAEMYIPMQRRAKEEKFHFGICFLSLARLNLSKCWSPFTVSWHGGAPMIWHPPALLCRISTDDGKGKIWHWLETLLFIDSWKYHCFLTLQVISQDVVCITEWRRLGLLEVKGGDGLFWWLAGWFHPLPVWCLCNVCKVRDSLEQQLH